MIVSRKDVIATLEDRLAGRISDGALAAWAFDLFYRVEQGQATVPPEDADAIAEALDAMMFADDPGFALAEADLRRLIDRLQQP
ncbi:MAG: hypothetical protein OHK0015_27730 [Chloroflexi bacterium OHK40]